MYNLQVEVLVNLNYRFSQCIGLIRHSLHYKHKIHYFIGKGVLLSNGAKKYFPLFFSAYYIARENINIFTGYVVGRENINIFTGFVIEYLAKHRKR